MQHRAGVGFAKRTTSRYLHSSWDDSRPGIERMTTFREVLGDELFQEMDALQPGVLRALSRAEIGPPPIPLI